MSELVSNKVTQLSADEVVLRAVQFFSTEKWRVTSQSPRSATFEGKAPIPWLMIVLTLVGLLACIVPGIVLYVMLIQKANRFVNLVVAASPSSVGTDVSISHPKFASYLVGRFMAALPAAT